MTAVDPRLTSLLAALSRGGDTMVAHINPQEAALLKALGGRGSINPKTGLPEFDDGGGGGIPPPAPPTTGAPTGPDPVLTAADFPGGVYPGGPPLQNGMWGGYTPSIGGAPAATQTAPDTAPAAPTIDPAQIAYYSNVFQQSSQGPGGGTPNPLLSDPSLTNPANNSAYALNPATGYYDLSPSGLQTVQGDYTSEVQSAAANAAKNASGLSGYLSTPLGGLSVLGIPGLFGGVGALLGGAGASDVFLGAADASTAAGAEGVDPALAGALAADVPSAGAGAATAGGAGIFGGATPDLAGATLASTGLGAAESSDASLAASLAADNPSIGAGAATAGGAGAFGGATPDLADATLASSGLFDPTTGALSTSFGSAATPAVAGGAPASAAAPQDIFLGGTAAQSVDPAVAAGVAGGGAPGASTAADAASATPDLVTSNLTDFPSGLIEPPIPPQSFGDSILGSLGKAGDWLGTQLGKNPLGALASAAGLGYTLLSGNKTPPQQTALQTTANTLGAEGQTIANDVLSGNNPLPGAQQLQTAATQLQQQAAALQAQVASGNLPQVGAPQLLAQANQLAAQSATLRSYLQTGTLPPGMQAGVDSAAAAAKASIRSAYAQRGMSGSSAEAQDIANVDTNKATQASNMAMQLFSQGMSEAQIADGVYTSLVNASTSVLQLSTQEQQLGLQAQTAVNTSATNLLNTALNTTGLAANIQEALLNEQLQQDAQLSQSIASFASALAGGAGKLALVNVGGTTTGTAA